MWSQSLEHLFQCLRYSNYKSDFLGLLSHCSEPTVATNSMIQSALFKNTSELNMYRLFPLLPKQYRISCNIYIVEDVLKTPTDDFKVYKRLGIGYIQIHHF